ncbi:non-ribosomal peptide synthetase [Kribbella soli]|uniref:Amino acid adenylation domain-containing protein n=1 Tax=Kribbella soli TaxID=1124743 RepID=A0A4R0H8Z0_9ACTN|nr:non-ribosomal peptide synthetase [Kribbella soli]TCC06298.1 amino acid adenylation domain-containing protein [Kribbella soli]
MAELVTVPIRPRQSAVWLAEQLTGVAGIWNRSRSIRVTGRLDTDLLDRAAGHVAARYEELAVGFHDVDGRPAAGLRTSPAIPVRVVDAGDDWCEQATYDACSAFDLATGPLARLVVYRLGPEDHVLVLTVHTIAVEAPAVPALLADLGLAYRALSESGNLDVVLPHRGGTEPAAKDGADVLSYWLQRLSGVPTVTNWPSDRSASEFGSGGAVRSVLPRELFAQIESLAAQLDVPWPTVLLTGLRVLLYRHTQQTDLLIGVPAEADLLACSPDTLLPARLDLVDDPAFRDAVLAEAAGHCADRARTGLSLSLLSRALRPESDLLSNSLVQVAFTVAAPVDNGTWGGLDAMPVQLPVRRSESELGVQVSVLDGSAEIEWTFSDSVLDTGTVEGFAARLTVLLADAVRDTTRAVSALELLTSADHRYLAEVEGRNTAIRRPKSMGEQIGVWVDSTPDAVAVRHNEAQQTYRELAAVSDAVAGNLAGLQLPPETPIGLLLPRAVELPAVIWGVLKAGHVCVPLDPEHPVDRIRYVLDDAGVSLVLTAAEGRLDLPEVKQLDVSELVVPQTDRVARPVVQPDALAYLLYTSGSTGRPKGVGVTHGGLANNLWATRELMRVGHGQRVLAVTTISFDIAMLELFLALVSGGETVIASREEARDGQALMAALDHWRPDIMQATPLTWQMLFLCGWTGAPQLTVSCGGDVVPPPLAARLTACTKSFWHTYGPTETTMYTACQPIETGDQPRILPIGRPLPRTWLRILDGSLRPVPPGAVGELCIGGAGVARGYTGRPGLTARQFVPDLDVPGARIYRSGDLARWRPDGRLELHGRNDRQVKIRGHRIEPGEIETVLASHADVELAAVAVTGQGDARRLVAYLQVRRGTQPARLRQEIKALAVDRLPAVMVPSAFGIVDPMPVQVNGKIDRAALSRMLPPRPDDAGSEAPDADEAWVLGAWSRVLDDDVQGGDFFAVGGDLPRAAQVRHLVRRELGLDLPLRTFVEAATATALAQRLRQARLAGAVPAPGTIRWLTDGSGQTPLVVVTSDEHGRGLAEKLAGNAQRRVGILDLAVDDPVAVLASGSTAVLVAVGADTPAVLAIRDQLTERTGLTPPVLVVDAPPRNPLGPGPIAYAAVEGPDEWMEQWRGATGEVLIARVPDDIDVPRRLAALAAAVE